jgi:hypothetical protein
MCRLTRPEFVELLRDLSVLFCDAAILFGLQCFGVGFKFGFALGRKFFQLRYIQRFVLRLKITAPLGLYLFLPLKFDDGVFRRGLDCLIELRVPF